MTAPRTETERKSFHERIFGKGSTPPLERLGRGQTGKWSPTATGFGVEVAMEKVAWGNSHEISTGRLA